MSKWVIRQGYGKVNEERQEPEPFTRTAEEANALARLTTPEDGREYNLVATKFEGKDKAKHAVEHTLVTGPRQEIVAKLADYRFMKELQRGGYKHIGMRATAE